MNLGELEKYSAQRNLNLGQGEKDYYQNVILFAIYSKISSELVFKGGTALAKCYGLNRFSEDLDFTVVNDRDFAKIADDGLAGFGIWHFIKEVRIPASGRKYRMKIKGPLYNGLEKTLCSITLDFSLREKISVKPEIVTTGYQMDIIPAFEVYAMATKEIFAEKIRALMTRESARDLYDSVFLLRKGVVAETNIINEKLKLAGLEFDARKLVGRCKSLGRIWNPELKSLVKRVPEFEEYMAEMAGWADSQLKRS